MIGQLRCWRCFIFVTVLESKCEANANFVVSRLLEMCRPSPHINWCRLDLIPTYRRAAFSVFYSLIHQPEEAEPAVRGGGATSQRGGALGDITAYNWTHFFCAGPLN